jgi:hypothetical protein
MAFMRWRGGIDLGSYAHCYKCGLSQKVCRRLEDDGDCEYPDVMLGGIFILWVRKDLEGVVERVGFMGSYEEDVWEWMVAIMEGVNGEWESN